MTTRGGDSSGSGETDLERGLDALKQSAEFSGPVESLDNHAEDHDNNHLALIYEEEDEQLAAVVPFMRQGLRDGERCIYITDEHSREEVLEAMRTGDVDVEAALDSGALTVHTEQDTYMQDGSFSSDDMIDYLRDAIDTFGREGDGLRIAGEMSWVLSDDPSVDELMAYEGELNRLFPGKDVVALCQYNRDRFAAETIREVIRTHPHLIFDQKVCQNVYYTPPEEFFGPDQPTRQVDRMMGTLSDRAEANAALEGRERALRNAYEIVADPERSFREQVDALLELGRETIGIDYATFSRVSEASGVYEFERIAVPDDVDIQPGDTAPLDTLPNCAKVVEAERTLVLRDVRAEAPELVDPEWGIASYLGTPVTVDDEVYGTFCFYDTDPRNEPFDDWAVTFVDLLSNWVEYELQRGRNTDRLAAINNLNAIAREINRALVNQSSREDIEAMVCERLADSDSYEFAWVGTVEDDVVVPSASADTRGYLDGLTITADDAPTGRGPTGRAVRTGEPQIAQNIEADPEYRPWREQARERGIAASAAIPIAHEGQQYGVLNIYTSRERAFDGEERAVVTQLGVIMGLAIAATERERDLTHERERLSFINSLLRHNLLNDLNTINAQAGILEPHVAPEGREHLDIVESRVDEMADLIDTMQSLTRGLVDDDHELEPIDLGTVLGEELDLVSRATEDAVFETDTDIDEPIMVMADDLLGEVFQNLLVNPVQHSDKAVPRVTVDVTASEEQVTVDVADNGPGVPDAIRDRIFEKGEKGFDSRGTGYGLYLVREIVDLYGGGISVENTESGGALFSVTLPRA